ncbi:hypothetical protein Hypma_015755 [Hypsizygus marmoreus]|uniref:Uncharacterized protein n=1 Tax=Hypsizygus marmoreus TaxID=39966 RepID=A0A369K3R5_HYPMA|nr:hypothetical protein Hypma_015755 [Hypsizygus marmoreus]
MSFQHFRLGELSLHQPLPPHLAGAPPSSTSSFPASGSGLSPSHKQSSASKQPYGSGDTDDGYTLVFPNLAAFHEWRAEEEERQTVEFVKGDTHGSKAVPPRFKDHTKLVCARHSRSGRKKYVKKHPERVRKVPSRKLEGQGCPASISYKTYFDTEEVRACYVSQHSHEIGPANLPFTRRGRKAAAAQREKDKSQNIQSSADPSTPAPTMSTNTNAVAGPSTMQPPPPMFSSAVSMLAPLPGQPQYQQHPPPFGYAPPPQTFAPQPMHPSVSHERWENMATLFHSIREHARVFEYPTPSVAALETVLIRLYLESPVGVGGQPSMAAIMQNGGPPPVPAPVQPLQNVGNPSGSHAGSDGVNEDSS